MRLGREEGSWPHEDWQHIRGIAGIAGGGGKGSSKLCPGQAPPTGLVQHRQGAEPSPQPAWEAVRGQSRGRSLHRGRASRLSQRVKVARLRETDSHESRALGLEATGRVQAMLHECQYKTKLTTFHLVWFKLHGQENAEVGGPSSALTEKPPPRVCGL